MFKGIFSYLTNNLIDGHRRDNKYMLTWKHPRSSILSAVSLYLAIASICLILFGCVKSEVVRKAEWEENLNDVFFVGRENKFPIDSNCLISICNHYESTV